MKLTENQFPEGFDWSWTAESMDERAERMKKDKDKKEDTDLLKKETWKRPPF